DRKVDEFYDFYASVVLERNTGIDVTNYRLRPSIVAHSFGSYIVGYAMQKYPDIRFDKVLLCGAVLPTDFDWSTLFHRDQVNSVRNEFGARDLWASIARHFVRDAGESGSRGFQLLSKVITQQRF